MFGADKGKAGKLDGKGLYIGIVQARFNESITKLAGASLQGGASELGVAESNIELVHVPGALEIPVALQAMAEKGGYDALVALGCIIRGETYHFELVANESAAGVTRCLAGLSASHRQRDPHHRKPGSGRGPPEPTRVATRPESWSRCATCWTTCDDRRQQAGPRAKAATGLTSTGARKASAKSAAAGPRIRAAGALPAPGGPQRATADRRLHARPAGFHKADSVHYDALLHGCIREAASSMR
jgi:6,7-dimethyl-8-ribityllumazine synthase